MVEKQIDTLEIRDAEFHGGVVFDGFHAVINRLHKTINNAGIVWSTGDGVGLAMM